MKNYAYDYEGDHYHVYSVGDNVEDESFLFPMVETQDNDDLVVNFVGSLEGIIATGKLDDCDHVDCRYSTELLAIECTCNIWCNKSLSEKVGQTPKQKDVEFLVKRLTIFNNRKAQHLRGERHVC